jgi:hypothetical protein
MQCCKYNFILARKKDGMPVQAYTSIIVYQDDGYTV